MGEKFEIVRKDPLSGDPLSHFVTAPPSLDYVALLVKE